MAEPTRDLIRQAPKVLLHDHLDGGLRPATIVELAGEIGHELPASDAGSLGRWFVEAADSGSLENAMERVATEAAAGEPMRGVRVRASLPRLGGAFRTGLLAAGAFLDDGNADLISASALQRMDETLAAFRNFGEARVDLEREPGAWKLRARLTPARPP